MCLYGFSSFFFDFLDSRLDFNRIFQVHDMTINFSFILFLFFCFFHSHDLSTPGNNAFHRWPSKLKHHFLCGNCFGEGCLLVKGLFILFLSAKKGWLKGSFIPFLSARKGYDSKGHLFHFCQQEKIMAQKYSRELGNFGQRASRQQSNMTLKYYGLDTFVFGH